MDMKFGIHIVNYICSVKWLREIYGALNDVITSSKYAYFVYKMLLTQFCLSPSVPVDLLFSNQKE